MHKSGRPTLVGTTSVERSEALAKLLDAQGAHQRHDHGFACLESLAEGGLGVVQQGRALLARFGLGCPSAAGAEPEDVKQGEHIAGLSSQAQAHEPP